MTVMWQKYKFLRIMQVLPKIFFLLVKRKRVVNYYMNLGVYLDLITFSLGGILIPKQ